MIRIEHLTKIFGENPSEIIALIEDGKTKEEIKAETDHVVGVQDVSLEVKQGEIFVIMGLSGSGKSTLLRCINRLIEPTLGKVILQTQEQEFDITALNANELRYVRSRYISMVFQQFGLLPHRTVLENVMYGLEVQRIDPAERKIIAQENLELVGLCEWGSSFPHELSGGMKQRVGLARALATGAEILLMDEPFSALDPLIRVNMQNELLSLEQSIHRTLLFITHDLDEALRIGDRVAIMDDGLIVQVGTPEEIIVNPQTEYVADFVEHADPTGVITASTIALSRESKLLKCNGTEGNGTVFVRDGYPQTEYIVDEQSGFQSMRVDGKEIRLVNLDEYFDGFEQSFPDVRSQDIALICSEDATLKDILRGRLISALPVVVLSDEGNFLGVINERDVVFGILEKRGQSESDTIRYEHREQ